MVISVCFAEHLPLKLAAAAERTLRNTSVHPFNATASRSAPPDWVSPGILTADRRENPPILSSAYDPLMSFEADLDDEAPSCTIPLSTVDTAQKAGISPFGIPSWYHTNFTLSPRPVAWSPSPAFWHLVVAQ